MQHNFIDRYSELRSPIHRLDPRTKIVCMLMFVLAVVTTPTGRFPQFGLYAIVILFVVALSRVPLSHVIKRACLVLPFVLLTAAFLPFWKTTALGQTYLSLMGLRVEQQGLILVCTVAVKAILAAAAMIVLSSSTRFPSLLKALETLRLPKIMLMILSFMYRYLFVALDQAMRMERARESRDCNRSRIGRLRTLGSLIGILFIRAFERSERVYQCMVSRGFDGEIRDINRLRITALDYVFAFTFLSSLAAIRIAGHI